MCGICGEIRFNKSKIDSAKAEYMMQSIKSRGPDNKGTYLHKNIFLRNFYFKSSISLRKTRKKPYKLLI